jgi:uncharacterized membrane protein (UPF0136 family)
MSMICVAAGENLYAQSIPVNYSSEPALTVGGLVRLVALILLLIFAFIDFIRAKQKASSDDVLKNRHGCLTTWLILIMVANLLLAIILSIQDNVSGIEIATYFITAIVVIVAAILLFKWKKIGFWIIVGITVLGIISSLIAGEFLDALRTIIPVGILWGVLQTKVKDGVSGWENME